MTKSNGAEIAGLPGGAGTLRRSALPVLRRWALVLPFGSHDDRGPFTRTADDPLHVRPKYRPEIDGLRAIAVMPVILFHAGFELFSGGFVGVDIFFVISGYLITSIVLTELDRGTFSLWSFYDRRLRRILPALLTVIGLTTIVATFLMVPGQLKDFGQSMIASVAFSANIYFWLKLNYWSQSSEFVPLLHLWSLGVEEQFYLLTPLMALFASKRGILLGLFAGLALTSFAAMLYMYQIGQEATAFYLLPFRAWEIAVGGVAALLQHKVTRVPIRDDLVAGCALLVLVACLVLLHDGATPAIMFGLPVFSTFTLILFCRSGGVTARLLSSKLLVGIGLISYSLYLFHQPVLALLRVGSLGPLDLVQTWAAIALTFLLASLTYKFVETPFRRHSAPRIGPPHYVLTGGMAVLFILGVLVLRTDGLREQKLAMMNEKLKFALTNLDAERTSRSDIWKTYRRDWGRPFGETRHTKVLFVGDSLSEDLFVAASMGFKTQMAIRRMALDEECIKTEGQSGKGLEAGSCKEELEAFLSSSLLRQAQVVVFANAWLRDASSLAKIFNYSQLQGKQIIVYKSHAFLNMLSVILSLDRFSLDVNSDDLHKFLYLNRHQRTLAANRTLQQISDKNGAATINAFNFFCDSVAERCKLFTKLGKPLLIDQSHLSASGVLMFREWFKNELSRIIKNHRQAAITSSE